MQLKPHEKYAVVRQLDDPFDTDTLYVQAKIRNAETDVLLETINLTDRSNQRFRDLWQVPADTSGEGFYIDIETIVYTENTYTTVSENYGRENVTLLVQDRHTPPFGEGGGAEVDYKRISKIVAEIVGSGKGGGPTKDKITPAVNSLKKELVKLKNADAIDKATKTMIDAVRGAEAQIRGDIKGIPPQKPVDFKPVITEIEKSRGLMKKEVGGLLDTIRKFFSGDMTSIKSMFAELRAGIGQIPVITVKPDQKIDDVVNFKTTVKTKRVRRIGTQKGFIMTSAMAIVPTVKTKRVRRIGTQKGFIMTSAMAIVTTVTIGILLVVGLVAGHQQNLKAQAEDVELGRTVRSLTGWKGTTTPESALTVRVHAKNIYIPFSSGTSTDWSADTYCINNTTPDCITAWPAGGGSSLHVDGTGFVYPTSGDYHSAPYYVATSTTADTALHSTFYVDSSTGNVGVGTSTPDSLLTLEADNPELRFNANIWGSAWEWRVNNAGTFNVQPQSTGANVFSLFADAVKNAFRVMTTELVINDDGLDYDFRVQGVGEENALFVQGSSGNVGIGSTTPFTELSVEGTIVSTDQLFSAYDSTGGISLPAGVWTAITLDTERFDDAIFTHGADSATTTINEGGRYNLQFECSGDGTPSIRTQFDVRLVVNNVAQGGTSDLGFGRSTVAGDSVGAFADLELDANDLFRWDMISEQLTTSTRADSCRSRAVRM